MNLVQRTLAASAALLLAALTALSQERSSSSQPASTNSLPTRAVSFLDHPSPAEAPYISYFEDKNGDGICGTNETETVVSSWKIPTIPEGSFIAVHIPESWARGKSIDTYLKESYLRAVIHHVHLDCKTNSPVNAPNRYNPSHFGF